MKEISELKVEFPMSSIDYELAVPAQQQQLLESIADLNRLCSLSLHNCSFGCLQHTPQLATLRSQTRPVNAHWRCVVVSTVHKMLIDLVMYLCAGVQL